MAESTPISKPWADQTEDEANELNLIEEHSHAKTPKTGKNWSKIVGNGESSEGYDLTEKRGKQVTGNVKITLDDIKDEIIYWKSAVICYVLDSNPPQIVMEGYFKRIWGTLGIDKIAQVN